MLIIDDFIRQNKSNFVLQFDNLTKVEIVTECVDFIKNRTNYNQIDNVVKHLECVKILSREKSSEMKELLCQEVLWKSLLTLACYDQYSKQLDGISELIEFPSEIIEEALKCLSNLTKNFSETISNEMGICCIKGAFKRMEIYGIYKEVTHEIKLFELRLLFILTALIVKLRDIALVECKAITTMCDWFKLLLTNENNNLSTDNLKEVNESVKVLFNLLYNIEISIQQNQNLEGETNKLLVKLRDIYFNFKSNPNITRNQSNELLGNLMNLMTTIPESGFHCWIKAQANVNDEPIELSVNDHFYQSNDAMEFYNCALGLLHSKLSEQTIDEEVVGPMIHGLWRACKINRNARKFCRLKILPYMRDEVNHLPEKGDTLRNKLCQLLQHNSNMLCENAAMFIFVICKESIDRAIKYTGFGNFAGFLARHSLLNSVKSGATSSEFSSGSSDSETEEYQQIKHKINPVTGRVEQPKPNPFENMTEEQKEFEAMQLVKQIDRLQRDGLIQPGIINEDGSLRPAEHVLELIEQNIGSGRNNNDNKSESD